MPLTQKFTLFLRILWGLVVLFCFVGVISGHAEMSAAMAIIVSVMWCLIRIVVEAIDAVQLLRSESDKDSDASKSDP